MCFLLLPKLNLKQILKIFLSIAICNFKSLSDILNHTFMSPTLYPDKYSSCISSSFSFSLLNVNVGPATFLSKKSSLAGFLGGDGSRGLVWVGGLWGDLRPFSAIDTKSRT